MLYYSVINEEVLVASNFVVQISETVVQEELSSVTITGSANVALSTKYVLKADVGKMY